MAVGRALGRSFQHPHTWGAAPNSGRQRQGWRFFLSPGQLETGPRARWPQSLQPPRPRGSCEALPALALLLVPCCWAGPWPGDAGVCPFRVAGALRPCSVWTRDGGLAPTCSLRSSPTDPATCPADQPQCLHLPRTRVVWLAGGVSVGPPGSRHWTGSDRQTFIGGNAWEGWGEGSGQQGAPGDGAGLSGSTERAGRKAGRWTGPPGVPTQDNADQGP